MLNKLKKFFKSGAFMMILSFLIVLSLVLYIVFNPMQLPFPNEMILVISLILPLSIYLTSIIRVGIERGRDPKIANPLDGNTTPALNLKLQGLSNTLEQFVFAFITYVMVINTLPPHIIYGLPLISLLFFIGRLFFIFGYKKPLLKEFGFGLTFFSTFIPFLAVVLLYLFFGYQILVS